MGGPVLTFKEVEMESLEQWRDLEAMRKEFVDENHIMGRRFSLKDDLAQVSMFARRGFSLKTWASMRGVPFIYALALLEDQDDGVWDGEL